jgi:hypothetical protein
MSYILKHLTNKHQIELELSQHPENIKYYAKYDTFIGDSNAVKFLESKIQQYLKEL